MTSTAAYHFISGLPRSGSTLLAALLRQNPALHANITSPVGSMVGALLGDMSAGNESAVIFTNAQRRAVLRSVFSSYYDALDPAHVLFDTNRGRTMRLDLLAELFPGFRVICCVRHVPWILDSIERLLRQNPFELSKIFNFDAGGTVFRCRPTFRWPSVRSPPRFESAGDAPRRPAGVSGTIDYRLQC